MIQALLLAAFLPLPLLAGQPDASQPDAAAMTRAWQQFAAPNENHKRLEEMVGTWTTRTKFWGTPDAGPQESEGTAVLTMVLGGRYLEQKHVGTMMGQGFEGLGYTGYDNLKRKYITTWMDNFGTSILVMTGKADATGKILRSQGTMDEVLTGKPQQLKDAVTLLDVDHFKYEMWTVDAKGKATKTMEIAYTRKK